MNIRTYLTPVAAVTGCAGRAYIECVVVDFYLVHQYNQKFIICTISRIFGVPLSLPIE